MTTSRTRPETEVAGAIAESFARRAALIAASQVAADPADPEAVTRAAAEILTWVAAATDAADVHARVGAVRQQRLNEAAAGVGAVATTAGEFLARARVLAAFLNPAPADQGAAT